MKWELPATKVSYKLPEILSKNEVQQIIKATGNIKHRTLLMLIYSAGLRVSEATCLQCKDVDSERMTLHIRGCKNRKDRYVILSPKILIALRDYWKATRFENHVFPGQKAGQPISAATASAIYKKAKAIAGVKKAGGIHGLRHAYSTHLLEAGEDIFVISKLLGHTSIHSTVRYLQFVPGKNTTVFSPIETLEL